MLTCSITLLTRGITVSYLHHHRLYSEHHLLLLRSSQLVNGQLTAPSDARSAKIGVFVGIRGPIGALAVSKPLGTKTRFTCSITVLTHSITARGFISAPKAPGPPSVGFQRAEHTIRCNAVSKRGRASPLLTRLESILTDGARASTCSITESSAGGDERTLGGLAFFDWPGRIAGVEGDPRAPISLGLVEEGVGPGQKVCRDFSR